MQDKKEKYSPKIQRERIRAQARLIQQQYKKNLDMLWNMMDKNHNDYKAISKLENENDELFRKIEDLYGKLNEVDDADDDED